MGCYEPPSWKLYIKKLQRRSEFEIRLNFDRVKYILKIKDPHPYSVDYQTLKRLQNCLEGKLLEIEKQKREEIERKERFHILQDLQKEL